MAKSKATLPLSTKLLTLLLVVSLAPLGVVTYFSTTKPVELFKKNTLERLAAVATAKATAIDQFTDDRRRDVERIATLLSGPLSELKEAETRLSAGVPVEEEVEQLPELEDAEALEDQKPAQGKEKPQTPDPESDGEAEARAAVPNPLQRAVAEKYATLKSTLRLILWDQAQFEELLVLDSEGRVVASTFEGHEKHTAAELDYFQQGRKATYVQAVFWSPITEHLTTMIATPIRLDANGLGVLAARLNLKEFFHLINDSTGLGATGETVVGMRMDDRVQFMAPTRHDADAALKRSLPLDARLPLVDAVKGQAGTGIRSDYRGVNVLAAWGHVPALDWGLVTKIDYAEAMQGVAEFRLRALWLSAFVVLLVVAVSTLVGRALVKPLRRLRMAADQVSRGDLNVDLDIRSRDEIGDLADSFERMVAAIKFFRAHSRSPEEDDEEEDPAPSPKAPSGLE